MFPAQVRTPRRMLPATLFALVLVMGACGTNTPSATPRFPSSASPSSAGGSPTPIPTVTLPGTIDDGPVRDHLQALERIALEHDGLRTAGTAGFEDSVDYVADQLRGFGYEVETPSFTVATYRELPGSTITVSGGGASFSGGDHFRAMIYSASGRVTAPVVTVGFPDSAAGEGNRGCAAGDWEGFPADAIALTPPGPCLRRDEAMLAQDAGAAALVVAYPDWRVGQARRPTLIAPDGIDIPVLAAIGEVGDALTAAADATTVVTVDVTTEIGSATVRNVIAEAGGPGNRIIMLGAHLDSVHDGPGINDNGSGAAAVLEIARLFAASNEPGTFRFAFWAAEEEGLHGSGDYVQSLTPAEREEIAFYLNLDMLGSPNGVPFVYRDSAAASGSSAISGFLAAWLQENGEGAEFEDVGGASDHYFFEQAGIPTGGIFSGATERKTSAQAAAYGGSAGEPMDACYHLACDTADNVDVDRVVLYARAAASAALLLARGELLPF